jgi:hypothetical protein
MRVAYPLRYSWDISYSKRSRSSKLKIIISYGVGLKSPVPQLDVKYHHCSAALLYKRTLATTKVFFFFFFKEETLWHVTNSRKFSLQSRFRSSYISVTHWNVNESRDSSVGITIAYGLNNRMIGVRFVVGAGNFFFQHRVQTGSGAHPAFYPMSTEGSFPGGKAAGVWSWPLTSI